MNAIYKCLLPKHPHDKSEHLPQGPTLNALQETLNWEQKEVSRIYQGHSYSGIRIPLNNPLLCLTKLYLPFGTQLKSFLLGVTTAQTEQSLLSLHHTYYHCNYSLNIFRMLAVNKLSQIFLQQNRFIRGRRNCSPVMRPPGTLCKSTKAKRKLFYRGERKLGKAVTKSFPLHLAMEVGHESTPFWPPYFTLNEMSV